jgi:hypothetical protein
LLALIYSYPLFAVAVMTLFVKIKSPQDYIGGVVLMALALFALWASADLQGMHGFSFGAGTAPRMFGLLLVALAAGIALIGLLADGEQLAHYSWRGPLFVSLAIVFFALAIRPLGLVVSAFASFDRSVGHPREVDRGAHCRRCLTPAARSCSPTCWGCRCRCSHVS